MANDDIQGQSDIGAFKAPEPQGDAGFIPATPEPTAPTAFAVGAVSSSPPMTVKPPAALTSAMNTPSNTRLATPIATAQSAQAQPSSHLPEDTVQPPLKQAASSISTPISPRPTTQAPPPGTTPAPLPQEPLSTPIGSSLEGDMASILKSVKLPETHGPAAQQIETRHTQFDTTLADPERPMPKSSQTSTPNPRASVILTNTAPLPTSSELVSVHTLKDDLQHVVKENKISYVRAVALEEERRHRIEERSPKPSVSRRSVQTLIVVVLLVAVGILALGSVFTIMQQRGSVSGAPLSSAILFAEQSVPFPIDNESSGDVRRILASARNSSALTLGAILQIVPVHTTFDPATNQTVATPVTTSEFLIALGTRAPNTLTRALGDDFFFGIHTVDENAPVIVIPVRSYERALAAMLEWEEFMNADLEPLFTVLSPQAMGRNGILTDRAFEDVVMRNYDVRALKDDDGTIQLYYSFPTRNILIIAESPFSFPEILSRLRADRRL